MMDRAARWALLGVGVATLIIGSPGPGLAQPPSGPVLRVADLVTGTSSVATMVMQERNLPAKYNLRVEFIKFTNPLAERAGLLAGTLDVGQIDVAMTARMKGKDSDVRVVFGSMFSYHAILVPKTGPVQKLSDLKGRRIGLFSPTSSSTAIVAYLLKQAGVNYTRDVKQHIAPPAALPELLAQGQVDAVETWEPMVSQILATGKYRELINYREWYRERAGGDLLFLAVAMRGQLIDSYPDVARRFVRMYQEANQVVRDPSSGAVERWTAARGITDKKQLALLGDRVREAIPIVFNRSLIDQQKTYHDILLSSGLLDTIPSEVFAVELSE